MASASHITADQRVAQGLDGEHLAGRRSLGDALGAVQSATFMNGVVPSSPPSMQAKQN